MEERELIYKIIEYGKEKNEFTVDDLKTKFKLNDRDITYIKNSLWHKRSSTASDPNHIIVSVSHFSSFENVSEWEQCRLLPSALFQYNDYLELKEARRNSRTAFWLSMIAIVIAILFGALQTYLAYKQVNPQTNKIEINI